jgi:hypothetical protein
MAILVARNSVAVAILDPTVKHFSQFLVIHRPDAVAVGLRSKPMAIPDHVWVWIVTLFVAPVALVFDATLALYISHVDTSFLSHSLWHLSQDRKA